MPKRNFYLIITALTILGYSWIAYHFVSPSEVDITLCVFKRVTSIPCPACGTSRSVLLITEGSFWQAALLNPLGYLISLGMLILPFWLLYDLFLRKISLFQAVGSLNKLTKIKPLVFVMIALVLVNWIWNIYKAL